MNVEDIRRVVRTALAESGLNAYSAALSARLPENAFRNFLAGHEPRASRLIAICSALGLEFYVGPKRIVTPIASMTGETLTHRPASPESITPVNDRDLAELIAILADAWEAADERGRGSILGRFNVSFAAEIERERQAHRILDWLGWRGVEGSERAKVGR